jgi:hypothetical protein
MNPLDDQLDRLFRAAGEVSAGAGTAPAYGLEVRAMASWREARSAKGSFWDIGLLVRGLIVASVIMAVSFWPALHTTTNPFAEFLQLTDSTISSDESP